jgi:GH15 family glucan-1,4-alpha-glucosidase
VSHDHSRYPPIGDYGLIGDSRASALVSRDGSVDWMCLPDMDSPSVFARLLDWDRGGYFQIAPDGDYEVSRRYLDDTNVLETTFVTPDGRVRLIDFMPAQKEDAKRRALEPLRALIRFVECDEGRVRMRLEYVPRPDYGRGTVTLRARSRNDVTATRGQHIAHLRSNVPLDVTPWDARAGFEVVPGERLRFSLSYSFEEPCVLVSDLYVDQMYEQTLAFWREWVSGCRYDGPYASWVKRSALALKLLSYAPSGAIVAAPTTSLPEEIGGVRNWDYRYCWIRDSAFTVKIFLSLGFIPEAHAFVGWLLHATHQTAPRLDPLYTLHGEPHAPEQELEHLEGYRGSKPVRIGNGAYDQHQFDVYGELIDALHAYVAQQRYHLFGDERKYIRDMADFVARSWRDTDAGIWEPRIGAQHYTHSKVMAWDALRHAALLVEEGELDGDADRWRREAEALREQVLREGYNEEVGAFTMVLGGRKLDAAVLMMPLIGFIPADDPRMLSTIDAIRRELETNGLVKRYEHFDDGLPGGEGGFLVCNFWLAAALAEAHRVDEAREVFERTLAVANDLGLLSEEADERTDELLGNFPQGFSHLGLIWAALDIAEAERGEPGSHIQWPAP